VHSAPASSACCCFHVYEPTLQQALHDSASVALHPSFASISGIAAKYGLASSDAWTTAACVQDTASAMLQEIREQEEEEQGTALQRNREAREVPTPFPASVCSARDRRCSQVVDATRLSLQRFAAMFSVGYRKIMEAQHRCFAPPAPPPISISLRSRIRPRASAIHPNATV
jgi:hypothetical protein